MVSKELLNELKTILKEDFNLNLTIDEVAEIATVLVGYFDLLVRINFENK
ncbi:MAG: hypothetical protein UR68_C0005G0030 [Candidatus Roizmanbacteria bacterium GW2011_GWA2_35_19]|uniref:Uncharacterized protein n=2 Tax=Candidatus Roizmaniibacteriota TaxID=1752723 RepID=A0A0G0CB33_9BACT|nr:MAG: hypothetical protein UR63_C0005G0014 [Candidatus Roizmanbacteria bacterium GW2011_GWC2_35_12]KKP73296.1 MAG: hypothetical protein UR68_C0005G0030 [Candidatus Roizmanbacteria bacterium GW2011_GWA2_35_19]